MDPVLKKIKRCIMDHCVRFTFKAGLEMARDGISKQEIYKSILNATKIDKVIRSRSLRKGVGREYLYILKSVSYDLTPIYTKGKLVKEESEEFFFILISAKLDED